MSGSAVPVLVIGAGLGGALVALALAERGALVTMVAPMPVAGASLEPATALSYGSMLGWGNARHWRRLQERHGDLGWRPCGLVHHGLGAPLSWSPPSLRALVTRTMGTSRVEARTLAAKLPAALSAAGVERRVARVQAIEPAEGGWWRLLLVEAPEEAPEPLDAAVVVMAAGAWSRTLWASLPQRLRVSWAGVLLLERNPGGSIWLEQALRGDVVQPMNWQRPLLERRAERLGEEEWIVDAGLAPLGEGVVVGQISLVRPGVGVGEPPDPEAMEHRLRQGLGRLDPALASLEGSYRQMPVSFCCEGGPLAGPLPETPGLWAFTGFSGAFAQMPPAAERLAEDLVATYSRA